MATMTHAQIRHPTILIHFIFTLSLMLWMEDTSPSVIKHTKNAVKILISC